MPKKYLVTGGAGFIGSNLVKRLVKDGYQVRVLDNYLRGPKNRLNDITGKIEMIEADIRSPGDVDKACNGVDGVIHLAFVNGTEFFYTKPGLVLDVGVKGMVNIIDSCAKQKVKEFILASSSEVYQTPDKIPTDEAVPMQVPDPMNPRYSYCGGKIISELMAINYGRKCFDRVMIFRPHNVYGPDMGTEHVIPQFILRMKEICKKTSAKEIDFPIQGTGKETRAFVFIDDFIDGLMKIIEKGKNMEIYNIGTMDETPIERVAMEIANYFRRKANIIPGELKKGGALRRCPDITKVKRLGYSPKISFKDGIRITAEWYDKNPVKGEI